MRWGRESVNKGYADPHQVLSLNWVPQSKESCLFGPLSLSRSAQAHFDYLMLLVLGDQQDGLTLEIATLAYFLLDEHTSNFQSFLEKRSRLGSEDMTLDCAGLFTQCEVWPRVGGILTFIFLLISFL